MPYKKTTVEGGVQYEVFPEPAPNMPTPEAIMIGCLGVPLLSILIGGMLYNIGVSGGISTLLGLVGAVLITLFVNKKIKQSSGGGSMGKWTHQYRIPHKIVINKEAVTADGKIIPAIDIQRIKSKNHIEVLNNGKPIAQMYMQKVYPISWRVDVESNGQAITIAGGLTETAASGLVIDISNYLGIAVK